MTLLPSCFWKRPKWSIRLLSCCITFFGLSLLGCSSSLPLSSTETLPSANAVADVSPLPANHSPNGEDDIHSLAQRLPITATVTINGHAIDLEVAQTPQQQAIGLMYRTRIEDNQGMLFPFSPPRPVRFWMRNVEIALDMLFIQEGQVVAIESQVPPCRTDVCPQYGPVGIPVNYVLELRGGLADELGIETGEPIDITYLLNR